MLYMSTSPEQVVKKQKEEEKEIDSTLKFGFRLICSTALYPLDYAKTLIQLGYEPIAPRPGRTLFGTRAMMLPNIFQYAAYIKSVDGFIGCFRGLGPRLVGNMLSSYYSEKLALVVLANPVTTRFDDPMYWVNELDNDALNEYMEMKDGEVKRVPGGLLRKVVAHVCGVVISHPFHVISIRMMAQFIGRERIYTGLFRSIKEIWVNEGIKGFFSGIVPRLWMDLCCMTITAGITYLFVKHVGVNKTMCGHIDAIASFTVTSIFYPYHVVSTCMAVQGSRLKAGNPPMMDHYINWRDCYARLVLQKQHKRGASLFFR
ncbi:mitochondrial carrier homolog 2 [Anopheles maculipalpis]|uniref:mitochondrial carrier homolog 2 n=1 Tax=Anopheles maculipalpis TaxID=1496333 RepID=UPI002158DD6C|nr:mitochondrial carrier homolog 2 [Anopheles maculipalpis]